MYRAVAFMFLILLLSVSSSRADSESPSPYPYSGCYELSKITWEPDPKGNADILKVPKKIWLTEIRGMRKDTFLLLPAPGEPQTVHDDNYWTAPINDQEGPQLRWGFGIAKSGVLIKLSSPNPPRMTGTARAVFDYDVKFKDAPVTATKSTC